ncbi:helix-turn-helix transcriptional regulator [Frigidibacter sp. RF13]|uniref:helix-turn-helix transcriptional regulator n=1 Tax=Frigidibacter sp. RF13 TaxID=2997340 RepID=UPI002270218C|nr:helix-turn-helix transcriptional regulator [Frigidibacter sp. RF13]MCY1127659.1 helix-turn-helix transcriptional regulator [Frigidibacter sp. RF13]
MGELIADLGQETLPPRLASLVRAIASFDYMVIFGYRGAARPIDLFDDFPADKRQVFVTDYQDGPYMLDPFCLAAARPVEPGLYRMRDLAPDRFYQGEYFRNYYVRTGLAEEIGYFVDLPGGAMAVVSLMRAARSFTTREVARLAEMFPVIAAIVRRQWHDLSSRFDLGARGNGPRGFDTHVEKSFHSFGGDLLTRREREIAEYTLKGHSADAIGRLLDISPGTVRIHRRNIYGKLRISSQGELFSAFIRTLSGQA